MKIIPLAPTPSQTFNIVLGGQDCAIKVYQKSTGVYLDVAVSAQPVVIGVLCQDRVRLIRQKYLSFIGDLAFMDTQGDEAPRYQFLGSRWVLMYLELSEI